MLDDEEKRITNLPQKLVRTDEHGIASFLIPTSPRYTQIRVSLEVGNPPFTSTHTATLRAYNGREYIALRKIPVTKKFSVGDEVKTELNFQPRGAFSGAVVAAVTGGAQINSVPHALPSGMILSDLPRIEERCNHRESFLKFSVSRENHGHEESPAFEIKHEGECLV